MARCSYCYGRVLVGGKRHGHHRFCSRRCHEEWLLSEMSHTIPEKAVRERVLAIFQGACPKCGGGGPVDIRVSYRVWSALVFSAWGVRPELCCPSCARKNKIRDTAFSFALGWWGIPWGPIITPIQIGRNLAGLKRAEVSNAPSRQLVRAVFREMGEHVGTNIGRRELSSRHEKRPT